MVILYFGASYSLIAAVLILILSKIRSNTRRTTVRCMPIFVCLALLPLAPYAVAEFNTAIYKESILPSVHYALRKSEYEDHILFLKVLSRRSDTLSVYVVTPCVGPELRQGSRQGEIIELTRTEKGWQFDEHAQTPDSTLWFPTFT